MFVINRRRARGRFVEHHSSGDTHATVLWDAAPDGRNSECWVEVQTPGEPVQELHGAAGWTLEQARAVAMAAVRPVDQDVGDEIATSPAHST